MINIKSKNLLLIEDSEEFIDNAVALFNMFVKKTFVAKDIKDAFDILRVCCMTIFFSF